MRGQALVLAALTVLVLALAVLTTINLGHHVYERERLQNTADAAAYSMAATEARAFNFYAYANRAEVSHYVSAMGWQSQLSFVYFVEAFTADAYGMALTLFELGAALPFGALTRTYLAVLRGLVAANTAGLREQDLDRRVGREVIPRYFAMNGKLTAAAEQALRETLAELKSTAAGVVRANDPTIAMTSARLLSGALSSCILARTHLREAWHDRRDLSTPLDWRPREDASKVARAKRAMGSVSNATRAPAWVTDRRDIDALVQLPSPLRPFVRLTRKWGQTRLLSSSQLPLAPGGNRIRDWRDPPGAPDGALAQGDELASDDVYTLAGAWGDVGYGRGDHDHLPFRFMLKTSIFARPGHGRSVHYRLVSVDSSGRPSPNGPGAVAPTFELGLNRVVLVPGVFKYAANVRPVRDGNHPWRGVAPFAHFEPGDYDEACGYSDGDTSVPSASRAAGRAHEFNQPSAFVLLQKGPAELPGGPLRELQMGFSRAGARLALDDTRMTFMGGRGLNVLSRAQVYYHRPGNWHEHPNFFNPYWRPRLASVLQGRYANPLVGELLRQLPERALTH